MTIRRSILIGVALEFCLSAELKITRDWARDPAIVQVDTPGDVFAIGDVHGDYDRLVRLLAGAKIVASSGDPKWIAGKATLVFTGDVIDKGPKMVAVLRLLRTLRAEAARDGGRVVVTMGNHEDDFLRGPMAEKFEDFGKELRVAGTDAKTVAACGGEIGEFLCSLPFGARVNDWFFSHAGNTGGRTMAQLIADLQAGVDRDGFGTPQLSGENSLLGARLGEQGPGGRSWFEPAAFEPAAFEPAALEPAAFEPAGTVLAGNAAALGVKHLVQGHQHGKVTFPGGQTRNLGDLYQWHGKLFLIDTGMSQEINDSVGAVLHIWPGSSAADGICPSGKQTKLWDARQKASAAKGLHCGA